MTKFTTNLKKKTHTHTHTHTHKKKITSAAGKGLNLTISHYIVMLSPFFLGYAELTRV